MSSQITDFLKKQISPELQEKLASNLNIRIDDIDKGVSNLTETILRQVESNPALKNVLTNLDKNGDGSIADDIERMITETGTNVPEGMKNLGAQIASHLTPDELNKLAVSMNIDPAKVQEALDQLGPVVMQQLQNLRSNPATSGLMGFVDKNVGEDKIASAVNKLGGLGTSIFGKPDVTKDNGKDI